MKRKIKKKLYRIPILHTYKERDRQREGSGERDARKHMR